MKTIYTLIVLLIISSCTNEKLKVDSIGSSPDVITLPLQIIKEKSLERKGYFNLDSVDVNGLVTIDSAFYNRYFLDLSINNLKGEKIEFDPYSRYFFFDYKDTGDLALFSIIHNDEIGYDNLYHFTYDRVKKQLLQVDYLAATGSDGGQVNVDRLKYNQAGDSLIRMSAFEDESDFSKGLLVQSDSIVYQILFNRSGTKYIKLDSISKIDTVWRKN